MSAEEFDARVTQGKVILPLLLGWMALSLIQAEVDHVLLNYAMHLVGALLVAGVSWFRTLLILHDREVGYRLRKSILSAIISWSITMGVSLSATSWIKEGLELFEKQSGQATTGDVVAAILTLSVPVFLAIAAIAIVAGVPHVTTLADDIRALRKGSHSHDHL